MRMTTELLQQAPSFLNPVNDRELDLRGHKIPAIENLGVAGPQDAIDLTDNDIQALTNFPLSPHLRTLLVARNRIAILQPNFATVCPSLKALGLEKNNLAQLADLEPLTGCRGLVHLVLVDNPVVRKENYRYWIIWRLPSVRFLDYARVTDAERKKGKELFGTAEDPSPLAAKILGVKSQTFDLDDATGEKKSLVTKLSGSERKTLEDRIKSAKSLEEVARLEKELREGLVG